MPSRATRGCPFESRRREGVSERVAIEDLQSLAKDALVSEDLDPGLIHRRPERRGMRIKEFVAILRDGILARDDT